MKPLQDSNQVSVQGRELPSLAAGGNFKTLSLDEGLNHLGVLHGMLSHTASLIRQRILTRFNADDELAGFVSGMADIVAALQRRLERDSYTPADKNIDFSIDPSTSGYPLFIRDLHYLNNERRRALDLLPRFAKDEQLVEDALFSLFRGVFPRDIIELKYTRLLYESLTRLPHLQELRWLDPVSLGVDGDFGLFRLTLGRLEENRNIPRFYCLYFRIPNQFNPDSELNRQLISAIQQGFSATVDGELKAMARHVEAINGIQLDMLQRVDIGPFYNRHTVNPEPVQCLLDAGQQDDGIFCFKTFTVQRISEKKVQGWGNWFHAIRSGDWHRGEFPHVLASPTHAILPYRLIQKAHHENIKLDHHVKMYGLTATGGIFESAE